MRTRLGLVLAAAAWFSACTGRSAPVAPTPALAISPAASVGLTVRVLTRTTELPIAGAAVYDSHGPVGFTDSHGELRTNVPLGVEFHISVAASGFVSLGAFGTVNSDERWTFYLEVAQQGSGS